jgi:hypothetical protein
MADGRTRRSDKMQWARRRPFFDGLWGVGRRRSLDGLSRALDNAQGSENKARQRSTAYPGGSMTGTEHRRPVR